MSAIAGIVYPDALQLTDLIDHMLAALKHRAKGQNHIVNFRNVQLGSIGSYFSNNKKTLHLSFDGWVENGISLKHELEKTGYHFHQDTIEDILLAAYQVWGVDFLKKINGEFALSLYDQDKNTLLLARDVIGKRPLYWYHDKNYFIFGSEIKALLSTGVVPQTPSPDALATYLFFGFTPQDLTPLQKVNKLLPAHYLLYSPITGVQIRSYWSYSSYFSESLQVSKSKIALTVNELIEEAVAARLPHGPLSCAVSGGLGSATIAAYAQKLKGSYPMEGFTVDFQGNSQEDLYAAAIACESLDIPQKVGTVSPQSFIDKFPKIVWYLDDPVGDPNILATWELTSLASRFSPTLFSGMGSDEILVGHDRYTMAERATTFPNRLMLLPSVLVQKALVPFLNIFYPDAAYNILKVHRTNPGQFEFLRNSSLFNENILGEASPRLKGYFDLDTFLHKFHHISRIRSNVSSYLYFDVKTRLPDNYILQYERFSRAHQLSWQTPFLDKALVEYAAKIPEPENLKAGETASYLKLLVKDIFPKDFIQRPKKTRKNFLSEWMTKSEVLDVFRLLRRGTLVETGFISERWLMQTLEKPDQLQNSFQFLFSILTLEVWFRLFINKASFNIPPNVTLTQLLKER